MSEPSRLHEDRVHTLETVAVLAGVRVPVHIGAECLPDMVRASADGTVLLVADAKATETPGCRATLRRLRRYARAVRPLVEAGVVVRLAVCHGDRNRQLEWQRGLVQVANFNGLAVACPPSTCFFDVDTLVTWIDLRPAGQE